MDRLGESKRFLKNGSRSIAELNSVPYLLGSLRGGVGSWDRASGASSQSIQINGIEAIFPAASAGIY